MPDSTCFQKFTLPVVKLTNLQTQPNRNLTNLIAEAQIEGHLILLCHSAVYSADPSLFYLLFLLFFSFNRQMLVVNMLVSASEGI